MALLRLLRTGVCLLRVRGNRGAAGVEFRRRHFGLPSLPFALDAVAVIRRQEVIDRILRHLALPLTPTRLGHADTVAFDAPGEPMPSWVMEP